MTKEMTKEELKEIQNEFQMVNDQIKKQSELDQKNIVKGKLQVFDIILNYLNKKDIEIENAVDYWLDQSKNGKNLRHKKESKTLVHRFQGASVEMHRIIKDIKKIKNNTVLDYFK